MGVTVGEEKNKPTKVVIPHTNPPQNGTSTTRRVGKRFFMNRRLILLGDWTIRDPSPCVSQVMTGVIGYEGYPDARRAQEGGSDCNQ